MSNILPFPDPVAQREWEDILAKVKADDERVAAEKKNALDGVAWLVARHPLLGGEYYRGLRPAALSAREFDWHTAVCSFVAAAEDDAKGPLYLLTMNGHPIKPEVIIVRPVREWTPELTKQAHANGQKVVADIDDDIWSHEDFVEVRPNDDGFDDWFWDVDAVLVSTPYLRKVLKERGHKAPIYVAPNCYDYHGLKQKTQPGLGVGTRLWMSGRMGGDLELYRDLFIPAVNDLGLDFVHIGHEEKPPPSGGGHGYRSFRDLGVPLNRLLELPSMAIPDIGKSLAQYVSIGLIAMSNAKFNKAKTETHAVELSAVGLPIIAASDHPLYMDIPGRVPLWEPAVRKRMTALLDSDYWLEEAMHAQIWAEEITKRNEQAYLDAISMAVKDLLR